MIPKHDDEDDAGSGRLMTTDAYRFAQTYNIAIAEASADIC